MGMLMSCDNRKCGKTQEPLLDKVTRAVFCSECGEEMKDVTPFAKNTLQSMGQFKREIKTQEAFATKCNKCLKSQQPKLEKNKLICKGCGSEHTQLNHGQAHVIKQFLSEKTNSFT